MVTDEPGSTVSFTFNGTAVWVYGTKSKKSGAYSVTLDQDPDQYSTLYDGSSDEDLFQQVLFEASGLDGSKLHHLTVKNNDAELTIDSVSTVPTHRSSHTGDLVFY